ncbi:SHOCT domain-containing protein [Clostridium sp. Marseille-QA1073]
MSRRVRVKQSKGSSLVGGTIGILFVIIGIVKVIPTFGAFGFVWTGMAVIITGVNFYNAFSDKGIANWEIDVDSNDHTGKNNDFEMRLRKLEKLRKEGLITEEEYTIKRQEILKDK